MKCYTVEHYDKKEDVKRFVSACESAFEERMENALLDLQNARGLRFFGLTGPTCSGKTTAARRMTELLETDGRTVHVVSLDDFYYDKEYLHKRTENDPNVEIDYDSEETIDIDLLSRVAEALFEGEKTFIPHFDFKSGTRQGGSVILPQKNDVFLFEGIQTLYPRVGEILDRHHSYRSIAICPQSAIEVGGVVFEPNEIRLCRRLVRDFRHRATAPEFTLYLWQSVRQNEEKNIFPNMPQCYATIDSTMPYEMGILKPYLVPLLRQIQPQNAFYGQAQELLNKIGNVQSIPVDYISKRSIYKEFI